MKRIYFIFTIFIITTSSPAQDSLTVTNSNTAINISQQPATVSDIISQAAELYSKGDFMAAAALYEQILKENGASAKIYYNLGNNYYKSGRIAQSILNYERALLLDPGDSDTRHNLEIARLKTVDKIEPVGEFFLTIWVRLIQNRMSTDQWSVFAIICFILLIACLFLFFFTRRIALKKLGFYSGISLLTLVIAANIFAYNGKQPQKNRCTAIILSQTTTIKSSPDSSGTDLFILHEGTKVEVKSRLNTWNEIETADGNVGWIRNEEIEII
ncbi:MAG: tetratricopeptide repeat protein [Dysgonamonadaceae bacterium]|jgi:tetratricopeptide (TPR) repeat protein|nr:tetratricopeptide repeat protein [Dysgonamonadaceae bacterium]